jgi:hypothetical protein
MEKFEYLIENNISEQMLNDLGSVGWELVQIKDNIYHGLVFYFKRKIETKPELIQPEVDFMSVEDFYIKYKDEMPTKVRRAIEFGIFAK